MLHIVAFLHANLQDPMYSAMSIEILKVDDTQAWTILSFYVPVDPLAQSNLHFKTYLVLQRLLIAVCFFYFTSDFLSYFFILFINTFFRCISFKVNSLTLREIRQL